MERKRNIKIIDEKLIDKLKIFDTTMSKVKMSLYNFKTYKHSNADNKQKEHKDL
jgi:hypothetical protein